MNGPPPNPEQRVIELIDLACDGRLSAEDRDELSELLAQDLMHYQTCVQYLDMHAELVRFAIQPLTCEELSSTISRETPHERRARWRKTFWTALTCVACVFACVVSLAMLRARLTYRQPQLAAAPAPLPVPLAKIVEISPGVAWQSAPRIVGEQLFDNNRIELGQGRVMVEFPSGVQVRYQGPGVMELDSALSVRMFGGRALANVPPAGKGFTIRAGDAVVIDYGTEFLIDASADQAAAVAVRQGQVGLGFGNDHAVAPVSLSAGLAVHLDGKSKTLSHIGYDPSAFRVFDLDRARISNLSGQLRFVLEPLPTFPLNYVTPIREALLLRENSRHSLTEDLAIDEPFGKYFVPKGTVIDTFIVHYSPDGRPTGRVHGSVSFQQPIVAIVAESDGLALTDRSLNIDPARNSNSSRGLDFKNTDKITLSEDRKTVTFSLLTAENYVDQFRVIVQSSSQP